MNNSSLQTSSQDTLRQHVRAWDKRHRQQQIVAWLARVLLIGLSVAVVMGLISRSRPWLTNAQLGIISVVILVLDVSALVLVIRLWPRELTRTAQWFDYKFELQERISTALELLEGRIHTVDEIAAHQIEDACDYAEIVMVEQRLPYKVRIYEWIMVMWLVFVLGALVLLPNRQASAGEENAQLRAAIAQTGDNVREGIEEIALDAGLGEETREELLESLQAQLETLEDEAISAEEALATANDIENMLQNEADALNDQLLEQREAMERLTEALQDPQDPPEAMEELSQNITGQSQTERQETADALDQAADALESYAPELAEALRRAAEALRQGDLEAAQEALEEAAQLMRDMQRQQEGMQQSAQQLEQFALQMSQDQQEIAEQSDQQQQTGQGTGNQTQPAEGLPNPGEEGATGEQAGGQNIIPEAQGDAYSQAGSPQMGESVPDNQGQSSQAGSQPADPYTDTTGAMDEEGESPNLAPPGTEREYEEVFAPQHLNTEPGDDEIGLQAVEGEVPLRERIMTQSPEGQVTVPYNMVFGDYANAANQALDQSYIPLGLRDVVREYFTSLAPQPGEGQ